MMLSAFDITIQISTNAEVPPSSAVLANCRDANFVAQLPKHTDRFTRSITHERANLPPSPMFAPLSQDGKRIREDIDLKFMGEEV
jgi:hypothetical protein